MNRIVTFLSVILLLSCNENNENLISFKSQNFRELTDFEFENRNTIETETKRAEYKDYIEINVTFPQAGCIDFDGDIAVMNDTLQLIYWNKTGDVCDELVIYKLRYRIEKKYAKKYPTKLVRER
ncbi:hypothetical protein [Psychroserpens sp. Hel_I_66]|uniref:hypothetical protein n=1 Tax=Psychroserpens sp. Hel_I_66 TaxID=1250004 RepID=UPI0006478A2A|nr:hypothetical protein [Psychroserpens sp. Hel_I_66]